LEFPGQVLYASGLYLYSIHTIGKVQAVVRQNVSIVDNVLAEIVSPTHQEFRVADLEGEFGYPGIDLYEIDLHSW
jgi:hypothetical protein